PPADPHRPREAAPGPDRMRDLQSGPHRLDDFPSGQHPLDDLSSGAHRLDDLPSGAHRPEGPPSGAYRPEGPPSGAHRPHGLPSGAHPLPDRQRNPAPNLRAVPDLPPDQEGASPPPILPLTTDSRAALWPLASDDDLRSHSRDLSRDVSQSRLAALPPAGERPLKGRRRPPEEDGNGWVREGRPTPLLILAAVAAAGAVTAAAIFFGSGGDSTPVANTAAPVTSTPAEQVEAADAPGGYKEHSPAGFTAAVPDSWKVTASGDGATFTGPKDSGVRIVVEHATPQADGGLAELTRAEAEGTVEGYIQVQLQGTRFRAWKAADWEYTYTQTNGVPMHAMTRYVTVDDKSAFKITFDMPELTWDDQAETRRVFLDTFRQSS
uniref:hypothetical protein n=1 Tax=Nonomuraea lactucae TaxID=2249762 RepID=UPI0013B47797